jgi:hypothetical protein
VLPSAWQDVQSQFSPVWIADGSTLEHLQQRMGQTREQLKNPLAGKLMMGVETLSHRPVQAFYSPDPQRQDTTGWDQLRALLPVGGLLILDLGFFGFAVFDAMHDEHKFFLTRQKHKVGYQVQGVLSKGSCYRDEIIQLGAHQKTHPCRHPVRQVAVLWGTHWRYYPSYVTLVKVKSRQNAEGLSPNAVWYIRFIVKCFEISEISCVC